MFSPFFMVLGNDLEYHGERAFPYLCDGSRIFLGGNVSLLFNRFFHTNSVKKYDIDANQTGDCPWGGKKN